MGNKKQIFISFRAVSNDGDTSYNLLPDQAVAKIKELAETQNKWVYINKEIQNKEVLTKEDLIAATEKGHQIILMNALGGGQVEKLIEINIKTTTKSKNSIVVNLDEQEYVIKLNIAVHKDQFVSVLYNRDTIIRALTLKLTELATREVNGIKQALNVC